MSDQIFMRLEAAKMRWMVGGNADAAGDEFSDAKDDAQLRLLAQSAVFKQACLRPNAPDKLAAMAQFPEFTTPYLDEILRPQFRSLIAGASEGGFVKNVIALMAARNRLAHPFDWLPPKDPDGFPEDYIQMSKWLSGREDAISDQLDAQTWEELFPAERRNLFALLRREEPQKALQLLEENRASLPAEERCQLVQCLKDRLSLDDADFLETLAASDRSGKVKSLANNFLAQLRIETSDERPKEMVKFLEKSKSGLLRRKDHIGFKKRLKEMQKVRLNKLIQIVPFNGLAHALECSPQQLAETWSTKSIPEIDAFMTICLETGDGDSLLIYWQRLKQEKLAEARYLVEMKTHLSDAQITQEIDTIAGSAGPEDLECLLEVANGGLSPKQSADLIASGTVRAALKDAHTSLTEAETENSAAKNAHTKRKARELLRNLGLLLDHSTAETLMDEMTSKGIHSADPVLSTLKFNASLKGIEI